MSVFGLFVATFVLIILSVVLWLIGLKSLGGATRQGIMLGGSLFILSIIVFAASQATLVLMFIYAFGDAIH